MEGENMSNIWVSSLSLHCGSVNGGVMGDMWQAAISASLSVSSDSGVTGLMSSLSDIRH